MTHRSYLDRTREIATVRRLQLQRSLAEAAQAQAAAAAADVYQQHTEKTRDAHLQAWRSAATSHGGLSPALLDNFATAFIPIATAHAEAREQRRERETELDAARRLLAQRDRLAERAEERVFHAGRRYRQALDEKHMAQLEIRLSPSMEDQ